MSRIRILNKKTTVSSKGAACIEECLGFIREGLTEAGVDRRLIIKTELLSEEMIYELMQHSDGGDVHLQIKKLLGDTVINISMRGEEFDLYGADMFAVEDADDEEAEDVIRSIILRSHGENLKYSYKKGVSRVSIKTEQAKRSMIKTTCIAVALALICGALMRGVFPEALTDGLCYYLIEPFNTMFMNALKMVIGPVIFFSIVTCLSQFKNLSELGRIGIKVVGTYTFTTILAVLVSTVLFFLIKPGEFGAALTGGMESQAVDVATNVDTSMRSMLINIVPSNFVKPFLEADTLQIIFLALICGVAVGMIGEYSRVLGEWFEACNSLFLTVTTIIARLIPVMVFCSVTLMIVDMGGSSILSLLSVLLTLALAVACMLTVYSLILLIIGRLNPLTFFKKSRESMLAAATIMSSSAVMPTTLNVCTEKLGISPKVASFSIPLGATINMDGTCIFLTTFGFYIARLYGIDITISAVMSVALTIILLSLGCPGVPGASIVCLGIVLQQLNVPVAGIGLIIAAFSFADMLMTMNNVVGDIMTATVTAKTEGLIDLETYNR